MVLAAETNYSIVLPYLIDKGFSIETEDNNGLTALLIACSKGNIEIVRLLCKNGANLNKADRKSKPPLQYSAENRYLSIVKLLIQRHAELSRKFKKKMTSDDYCMDPKNFHIIEYLKSIQNRKKNSKIKDNFKFL